MVIKKDGEPSNRFDYNRIETIKFQKEMEEKKKTLLEKGRPEVRLVPMISWNNFIAAIIGLLSVGLLWFGFYPEPPFSPILFQWESMGHKFNYKEHQIFYIDNTYSNTSLDQRQTLLILHGFPTSSFDFHILYPNLTKVFHRIVAPDLLGFGFSSKPRSYPYSIMDQTDLLIALLDRLQINNVHLFTHDYGDTVAQELLARDAEGKLSFKLNSVCMMNGGIFPSVHTPTLSQKLLRVPVLRTILAKFANFPLFSISINKVFGRYTQASYRDLQDFWKLVRLQDGYRVWPELLNYIDERFQNEDRWISALKTKVPFHFIYGPADPVNPSPIFEQTFRGIVGAKHLTVLSEHIGHYPHLEDVDSVFSAYMSFLKPILESA